METKGKTASQSKKLDLCPVEKDIVVWGENNRTSTGEMENTRNCSCPSQSSQSHRRGTKGLPEEVQPWLQPWQYFQGRRWPANSANRDQQEKSLWGQKEKPSVRKVRICMKSQNTIEDTHPGPVLLSLLFPHLHSWKPTQCWERCGAGAGGRSAAGCSCPGLQPSSDIGRKRSGEEALRSQNPYSRFSSLPQLCSFPTTDGTGQSFTW